MCRASDCPSAAEMQDLVCHPLSDAQAEALGRHLEGCESCASTVDALLSGDTMAAALRTQGSGPSAPPLSAQARDLIGRLRALRPHADGQTLPLALLASPDTLAPDAAPTPAGSPPSFLAAPRGPGELGWLGSFRVLQELGAGGMGMVFLAEDTLLERRVALKVMRPELIHPEQRERFLREARQPRDCSTTTS